MSLYAEEGANIRGILEAKIDSILKDDGDKPMIRRFASFGRLLKELSPTMDGEERKNINVLYMIINAIHQVHYNFIMAASTARAQATGNPENEKEIDEQIKKFENEVTVLSETFLTNLKEVLSTAGSDERATTLFENTLNDLVEDVLHPFTV